MDATLKQLQEAVSSHRPIILKGMNAKLGMDRCSCIWKILWAGYYTQSKVEPTSDGKFDEHWTYKERV